MEEQELRRIRRLNFVAIVNKYGNQAEAASAMGINPGQVSHIVTDRKSLGDRLARKIERNLKLDDGYLSKPFVDLKGFIPISSAPSGDSIGVLQYRDIRMSAGPGCDNSEYSELDLITFKASYIEKKGLEPEMCFCCYADGDSMSPSINDGDLVLVDRLSASPIRSGKIYAINNGDECRLKRIMTLTAGGLRIVSDNPDKLLYADEIISGHDLDSLNIIGVVVWSGGDK